MPGQRVAGPVWHGRALQLTAGRGRRALPCCGGPGPGGGRPVHDTQPGPGGVPVTPGRRSVPTATPSLRSVPPGVSLSRQRTRGTAAGPRLPAPDCRARAVRASAVWVSGVPCAKGSRSSRRPPGGGCRVQHARHRLKEQGHPALPGGAPACSWCTHWPSWGRALWGGVPAESSAHVARSWLPFQFQVVLPVPRMWKLCVPSPCRVDSVFRTRIGTRARMHVRTCACIIRGHTHMHTCAHTCTHGTLTCTPTCVMLMGTHVHTRV